MATLHLEVGRVKMSSGFSSRSPSDDCGFAGNVKWSTQDYIDAHVVVITSGKHNYQGCKIPIPTKIRYDRIKEALGNKISAKEHRVLSLLEFGMPIDCNSKFGIKKPQKKHHSAVSFTDAIEEYLGKNIKSQAILSLFKQPSVLGLCFSPLMRPLRRLLLLPLG